MDVLLAFSPCAYTLHTLYSDLFSFMSIRLVSNAIRYVPFRESIQFINYFKKCVIHSNGTKAEINRGEVTADVPLIARVKFSNWTGFFRIIFFWICFFLFCFYCLEFHAADLHSDSVHGEENYSVALRNFWVIFKRLAINCWMYCVLYSVQDTPCDNDIPYGTAFVRRRLSVPPNECVIQNHWHLQIRCLLHNDSSFFISNLLSSPYLEFCWYIKPTERARGNGEDEAIHHSKNFRFITILSSRPTIQLYMDENSESTTHPLFCPSLCSRIMHKRIYQVLHKILLILWCLSIFHYVSINVRIISLSHLSGSTRNYLKTNKNRATEKNPCKSN